MRRVLGLVLAGATLFLAFVQYSHPLVVHAWSWPEQGVLRGQVEYRVTLEVYHRSFGPLVIEGIYKPVEAGSGIEVGPVTAAQGLPLPGLKLQRGDNLSLSLPIRAEEDTVLDYIILRYRFWGFSGEVKIPS